MSNLQKTKSSSFFFNNWTSVFYNPFFFTRKELFKSISNYAPKISGKLIDLGCGTKPYEQQFINVTEYIGLDIEYSGNTDTKSMVDIYYDGKKFPFENDSIDNFFSSETFEHIFNLEDIVKEINRTLKKNGMLLATCPFLWPEHEIPYDYARYTSFAIKDLLIRNGFEIVSFEKTGNFITSVLQMQALYIYFFINKIPFLNHLLFVLFISPIFIFGSIADKILPKRMKRKDLYLNNVILARKIS